ncbi:MAG: hypothetical protein LBL13_02095 [Bacteroidales bacterium]|nr:hypothetical protein [Bacteroidales bacterium]
MKYLLIEFDNEQQWLEIGDAGHTLRQLVIEADGQIHVSCLEDCLAEGIINENELGGTIHSIAQHEFENKWNAVTAKERQRWNILKERYPIGTEVECTVKYSYPQGWVTDLDGLLGICKCDLSLYPGQLLSGQIGGYDEENMWLVISKKERN